MGRFLLYRQGTVARCGDGERRLARSELSHDSEGAFDILRYWVTGSEEQEWHFQAGLSGDSIRKNERLVLFTRFASLG